jgi:hypothetical protein
MRAGLVATPLASVARGRTTSAPSAPRRRLQTAANAKMRDAGRALRATKATMSGA